MKDFKSNWRDSRIYYLERRYGDKYNEWKDKDYTDDRIVAMNHHM